MTQIITTLDDVCHLCQKALFSQQPTRKKIYFSPLKNHNWPITRIHNRKHQRMNYFFCDTDCCGLCFPPQPDEIVSGSFSERDFRWRSDAVDVREGKPPLGFLSERWNEPWNTSGYFSKRSSGCFNRTGWLMMVMMANKIFGSLFSSLFPMLLMEFSSLFDL